MPSPSPRTDPASSAERPPGAFVPAGRAFSIDASGLDPAKLGGQGGLVALQGLFAELVESMGLHPIGPPLWHLFDAPGGDTTAESPFEGEGVTGIVALSESHLACHSFPEHGGLTLDLYTCRHREAPDWAAILCAHLARPGVAPHVEVRVLERSFTTSSRAQSAPDQA